MSGPGPANPRSSSLLSCALVLAAGLFAWWGVWRGKFLFDDLPSIVDNVALQNGDWWNAAFAPRHQPLANRPFACLTLVIDLAIWGRGPFGPHLGNLLLHLANGVLLFFAVRRTLLVGNLAGRFTPSAAQGIATAVASLWVAHPLGGDAVAYATQRSTLLAGGLFLVALLAMLRAHEAAKHGRWRLLVLVATALGMASKEDFVVAPLLLVLFERAFLQPDWAAMRAGFLRHATLLLTWVVLAAILATGPSNETVGWNTRAGITAWQWLMTQASVVVMYARLAMWPYPLRGAYDLGIETNFLHAVVPGLVVLAGLVVTLALWRRRPWQGWLGALFFLWLAPTSTILPIETEIVAERRVYLPMLAVIVPIVFGVRRVLAGRAPRPTGAVVAAVAVCALAFAARDRVAVHADGPAFFGDAFAKRDPKSRSFLAGSLLVSQAMMLSQSGRFTEADALLDEAVECEALTAHSLAQHAVSLQRRGRHAEAIASLRSIVKDRPQVADVYGTLGTCLGEWWQADHGRPDDPRIAEAEAALRHALTVFPLRPAYWNSLSNMLAVQGRLAEAEEAMRHATELQTERVEPFLRRADLLNRLGRKNEIGPMFERLFAARPNDAALRERVARELKVLGIQK
ncbi:MAG: hypothetical protein JNK78_00010 [Planctomycetes bacterium]|nr:hypothetical protein [Planctomycetota bacterium]